jgi:ribosomal protein S6--L-glutamate ligase
MKIAILSRDPDLYPVRRLLEVAQQRGHEAHFLDVVRCYMNITAHRPAVRYNARNLTGFDAVVPLISQTIAFYGMAVLRQFEMMGLYTFNSSLAVTRSLDKLRALQLISRKSIGLPVTGFAHRPDDIGDLIKMVGGAPLVIKLLQRTQGIGVVLAETQKAAESVIESFMGLKANILVQEYIKEAGGSDIRCLVVGDRVMDAIKRQAKEGEFKANLHRGATPSVVRITPAERSSAVKATHALGLKLATVDILRSNRGPLVQGVSAFPRLESIETTTNKDLAGTIIQYIERQLTQRQKGMATRQPSREQAKD